MIYRVLSPVSYRMDIGVLAYLNNGHVLTLGVHDVLKGLAPFSYRVPHEETQTAESLYQHIIAGLIEAAAAAPRWTRAYQVQMNDVLFTLNKELRRWRMEEAMETSTADYAMRAELEPIGEIVNNIRQHGDATQEAFTEFALHRFANDLGFYTVEAFGDVIQTFLHCHRGKIVSMEVKGNTRGIDRGTLELKLLIEIEEGENDS